VSTALSKRDLVCQRSVSEVHTRLLLVNPVIDVIDKIASLICSNEVRVCHVTTSLSIDDGKMNNTGTRPDVVTPVVC